MDPRHARLKMAGMSTAVLFASVAREYANVRPGYPAELFEWLARTAPRDPLPRRGTSHPAL